MYSRGEGNASIELHEIEEKAGVKGRDSTTKPEAFLILKV